MQWEENSPDKTIQGIKLFLDKNILTNDFSINIFGKENLINDKISKYKLNTDIIQLSILKMLFLMKRHH